MHKDPAQSPGRHAHALRSAPLIVQLPSPGAAAAGADLLLSAPAPASTEGALAGLGSVPRVRPASTATTATASPPAHVTSTRARTGGGITRRRHHSSGPGAGSATGPVTAPLAPVAASANVIEKFVDVIPAGIWIALGGAVLLAIAAGATSLLTERRVRRQAAAFAAVSAQALTDPLTGVLNRRGFLDAAERELARSRRYRRPFVLAFADIRGLKAVNDSEGHLAGDELVRAAASLLRDSARADDVVGRIGGDELALLLAEQSIEGGAAVVRRIKSQVPERQAELGLRARWDLTIGTAAYPRDGLTVEELLRAADRRLYEQRGISLRSANPY